MGIWSNENPMYVEVQQQGVGQRGGRRANRNLERTNWDLGDLGKWRRLAEQPELLHQVGLDKADIGQQGLDVRQVGLERLLASGQH